MHDNSEWQSIDKDLGLSFPAHKCGNPIIGYCLCIIDKTEPGFNNAGTLISSRVNMLFHEASATISNDCFILLKNCL